MEDEGETSGENDKFEDEEEEPLVSIHAIVEDTMVSPIRTNFVGLQKLTNGI